MELTTRKRITVELDFKRSVKQESVREERTDGKNEWAAEKQI